MLRSISIDGVPGATATYTSTDVAQTLPAAVTTIAGRTIVGFLMTVETNPVSIAFGGAIPTQGASPLRHLLSAGDTLKVSGSQVATTFRYISAGAGNASTLQITPFYTS